MNHKFRHTSEELSQLQHNAYDIISKGGAGGVVTPLGIRGPLFNSPNQPSLFFGHKNSLEKKRSM